jgi:small GTP-binding protein
MLSELKCLDLKLVVLGAASVGKTSIIHRYCNGLFQAETLSTIGAGFFTHTIVVGDVEATLFLWDTAGEERFRSVAPSFLRGAHGVVLVYDVSQPQTFSDVEIYLEMFLDTVPVDISTELPVLLLGNKADLEPEVKAEAVAAWCQQNRIAHNFRVSAKTGADIEPAMMALVKALVAPKAAVEPAALQLTAVRAAPKEGCC